jgi:hypothetical protein
MQRLVYLSGGAARRNDSLRAASGGAGDDDFAVTEPRKTHSTSNRPKIAVDLDGASGR